MNQGELNQIQSLPLELKIKKTQARIREWYEYWGGKVYVSFSGGKDSTVLLDLVRKMYPDVVAVYVNTGLEYPEINEFVKTIPNVVMIRPETSFYEVLQKYGYPVISKNVARYVNDLQNESCANKKTCALRRGEIYGKAKIGVLPKKWRFLVDAPFKISSSCCDIMKKKPIHKFEKESGLKGFIGTMATDSNSRRIQYLRLGCNSFGKTTRSAPMSFWTTSDIWGYIHKYEISYSSIYNKGVHNTGCMFCMFGVHREKYPNRFQLMKQTHPQIYDYCINKLNLKVILDFIGVKYD